MKSWATRCAAGRPRPGRASKRRVAGDGRGPARPDDRVTLDAVRADPHDPGARRGTPPARAAATGAPSGCCATPATTRRHPAVRHQHEQPPVRHRRRCGADPATSVLDPWCRSHDLDEPVGGRRRLLPVVGGDEPGPDHRGAGAARRRRVRPRRLTDHRSGQGSGQPAQVGSGPVRSGQVAAQLAFEVAGVSPRPRRRRLRAAPADTRHVRNRHSWRSRWLVIAGRRVTGAGRIVRCRRSGRLCRAQPRQPRALRPAA